MTAGVLETEILLTDYFLENGIIPVDYTFHKFVSFFRDYEEIEFEISSHILKGVYRKGGEYLLSLELKDLCESLGLKPGVFMRLKKYPQWFRKFEVFLPVSEKHLGAVLDERFSTHRLPGLQVEFPALTRANFEEILPKKIEFPVGRICKDVLVMSLKAGEILDYLQKKEILSLQGLVNVQHFPHQIDVVRKVLFECQGRALLADEVGMGKTIEAGLILREYLLRGEARKVLILVPASLTMQWAEELSSKFDLEFTILQETAQIEGSSMIISSLDLAKSRRFREAFLKVHFDLVIVDEAHKLKNRRTLNYRFVKSLSSRFLLLLTATPIQNDLVELYNLIHLVAPGVLGTLDKYKKNHIHPFNKRLPLQEKELRSSLSNFMIRNHKDVAMLKLPPRRVILKEIHLSDPEREIYEKLSFFIREAYYDLGKNGRGLNQLTLMLFQKLVTSSPQALSASLMASVERGELRREHEEFFLELSRQCDQLASFEKFRVVEELLTAELVDEKVIIFTQFRKTQAELLSRIQALGIETCEFHGEMSMIAKNRSVERFRDSARVLVSTDCGAEGRNLQFSRCLINFDLPWNPMKVEQRIGRIHRLGQEKEVLILNFRTMKTIEEYIVDLLSKKIRLFERIVGELEMILGYMESELRDLNSFDQQIMEIIVKYRENTQLGEEFAKLGEKFSKAGRVLDEVRSAQRTVFGE